MIITVRIRKGNQPIELSDGILTVYTNEEMIENRANIDIIKQLSKFYKVNYKRVKILKGHRSRRKIIEISDHEV